MKNKRSIDYDRICILEDLEIMDTLPEDIYDDITVLAASICDCEFSFITLLDDQRQFLKSNHGVDFRETSIENSICKHIIHNNLDQLIVEDLRLDKRFLNNPLVLGEPNISFYAGVALTWPNGVCLGSLCVADSKPKKLNENQINGLKTLAKQVIHLFELRRTRKEVLEKNRELEKIMNSSLDVICTINEDGTFISMNTASKRIWGYDPEELIGRNYMDFVYKEDHLITEKVSTAIISGKKTIDFENRYIHKNNSLVTVLWSANWNDQDKTMYCVARDITENKKARLLLEHNEQRFKTLVQEGCDLIAILDEEANYEYVSPTSAKILQIEPEEFIGKNAFEYIHPEDQDSVYKQFKEITVKSQVNIEAFRFKNKNGEWRWVETVVTNQLKEPSLQGFVANSRDVTERISYLKAIEEQNTKLKEIAWTQSHVMRAPLARLMGLIELIKDENLDFKEKNEILSYILKSAEEIDAIIKQIVENSIYKIEIKDS